jgi:hypothetical protein
VREPVLVLSRYLLPSESDIPRRVGSALGSRTSRVHREVGWVAMGQEIRDVHHLATWEYEVLMGNLVRLNLCKPSPNPELMELDNIRRGTEWLSYQRIEFTRLGIAFVRACQGPTY